MFELILFLGILAAIVLAVTVVGFLFKIVFHIAWIPVALVWGLLKLVGVVILCVLALVVAPLVLGPALILALLAAVVLGPFLLLFAAGAAVCGLA